MRPLRRRGWIRLIGMVIGVAGIVVACADAAVVVTPTPSAGTPAAPREVNLIAKDDAFVPASLDLIPGETVLLHVINGGLQVHEAVIGDSAVQAAWEAAEAATVGSPPGPTPIVSVPPSVAGVRIVVASGQRVDLRWTVPATEKTAGTWIVGCHIPGHFARGMSIPVHWLTAAG